VRVLIAILCAIAFVGVFAKPIRRFPVLFYGVAVVLDILLLLAYTYSVPFVLWDYLLVYVQRCLFAQALLFIVMFIGVLGDRSPIKARLLPIRGELSIIAAILALGHALTYLSTYFGRVLGNIYAVPTSMALSFLVSSVLLVLLVILTVTSFRAVKKRMDAGSWRRVQWFAYPFFLLIYVHLVLVLLQPALAGATQAVLSIGIYSALFLAYVVLRLRKMTADRMVAARAD